MRKRGVVILMAAALTASVPATALADQFAGQIALNGEAALEGIADEERSGGHGSDRRSR